MTLAGSTISLRNKRNALQQKTITRLSLVPILLVASNATQAAGFADDFSTDFVNPPVSLVTRNLAAESTASINDSGDLLVNIIHSDPDGDERAQYEVQTQADPDYLSATGSFTARPETGNLRFEIFGEFFNRTMDGGTEPGERTDNVELEIEVNLGPATEQSGVFYCLKYRDANGDSQPILPSGEKCFIANVSVEPNTDYTIGVGIDRETNQIIISVNDLEIREDSPYPFFEHSEGQDTYWTRFRVRDGATSGSFVLSDLSADGESYALNTLLDQRYKTDNFDNFADDPNRSKEIVDNRLRLSTTNNDPDNENDTFLRFNEPNDYIEADLVFSSESDITLADGFAAVRVAGSLYNERSSNRDDGNTGDVWGSVMLIQNADGNLVGEYCLIRADVDDWSISTDLADGLDDDRCPTFDLPVELDRSYTAILSLDQVAKTVTFELGGERKTVNLTTDIFKRNGLLRAQSRMARGATGTVVGYVDNLRSDANAKTDEERSNPESPTPTDTGSDAESSNSGGGGSIGFWLLALLALPGLRRANASTQKL